MPMTQLPKPRRRFRPNGQTLAVAAVWGVAAVVLVLMVVGAAGF
jgi:hypothetical protein